MYDCDKAFGRHFRAFHRIWQRGAITPFSIALFGVYTSGSGTKHMSVRTAYLGLIYPKFTLC